MKKMKVKHQTNSRMVLTGIPGRRVWMIVLTCLGVLLSAGVGFFAIAVYRQNQGLAWPHFPLMAGFLIAQALFWTGVITLAVGRLMLILDAANGTGEYHVKSPIVDAGRPCTFKLDDVHSVTMETATESRPGLPGDAETIATVHRACLRLKNPRRAITLDETENDRLDRVEKVAQSVAAFLGRTLERIDHG